MIEQCRCNCGYTCGGPGKCPSDVMDCLADGHWVKDCDHKWDGPVVDIFQGRSVTCSVCKMTAIDHDCMVGP